VLGEPPHHGFPDATFVARQHREERLFLLAKEDAGVSLPERQEGSSGVGEGSIVLRNSRRESVRML
jgi:hypothetical protein